MPSSQATSNPFLKRHPDIQSIIVYPWYSLTNRIGDGAVSLALIALFATAWFGSLILLEPFAAAVDATYGMARLALALGTLFLTLGVAIAISSFLRKKRSRLIASLPQSSLEELAHELLVFSQTFNPTVSLGDSHELHQANPQQAKALHRASHGYAAKIRSRIDNVCANLLSDDPQDNEKALMYIFGQNDETEGLTLAADIACFEQEMEHLIDRYLSPCAPPEGWERLALMKAQLQ